MSSKMAKRRRNEIPNINEEPRVSIERNEINNLTKEAKSWDFTCSFCFRKFPSAQAMGGHQNAHRSERLKEKRLNVKDQIAHRKRAYIRAKKSAKAKASAIARNGATCKSRVRAPRRVSSNIRNLHAAARMVRRETANFRVFSGPPKILPMTAVVDFPGFNVDSNGSNHYFYRGENAPVFYRDGENPKSVGNVVDSFDPPKELRLSESVGVAAGDVSGKACIDQCNVGGLDLTLRL